MPQNKNDTSLRAKRGNPPYKPNGLRRHFVPRNDGGKEAGIMAYPPTITPTTTDTVPHVILRLDRGISSTYKTSQSGNVFIIIMLAVFLFGALMYMFSRGAQQGTGNLTKQQAKIVAQEILNYARLVEGAVDRVRRNGCSETEISFENDVVAGYEHTPPARDECKIFHDDGGKVSYMTPPENWNDSSQSTQLLYNELYFNGRTCVSLLGGGPAGCPDGNTNYSDLMMIVPYLNRNICAELNNSISNAADILVEPQNAWLFSIKFNGEYRNSVAISYNPNKENGCFEGDTNPPSGTYHFYHVLLAR